MFARTVATRAGVALAIGMVAVAALVVALARAAVSGPGAQATSAARTQAENRAVAERDAPRLLHRAILPPHAVSSAAEPPGDGGALRQPGIRPAGVKLVDDHAFWTVPAPQSDVKAFVRAHPPRGARLTETVTGGPAHARSTDAFRFTFVRRPRGIASRALVVEVAALGSDSTGVRADAEDSWAVPRARSERVPSGVRTLRITRSSSRATRQGGHAFAVTVRDHRQIQRIMRWIDALAIVQPGTTACPIQPAAAPEVRFAFLGAGGKALASAAEAANVREPTTACDAMRFAVGGRAQPALVGGARFLARVDRLLHLHLSGK